MRYELKSISLWSVIKVSFFLNMIIGFILGLFYAFFIGIYLSAANSMPGFPDIGFDPSEISLGPLLLIFPLLGAVMGAFFHTLFALFVIGAYNLICKLVGGLVLELNEVDQPQVAPQFQQAQVQAEQRPAATTTPSPPPPAYAPPERTSPVEPPARSIDSSPPPAEPRPGSDKPPEQDRPEI